MLFPCSHYGFSLYFSSEKAAFISETSLFQPFREGFNACPGGSQSLCPRASKAFGSGWADPASQATFCPFCCRALPCPEPEPHVWPMGTSQAEVQP